MISPISATAPQAIIRRRYGAQTVGSDGRPDRGASTDTTITAVVAPASPRQLEMLPDGMRSRQVVSVHAHSDLRVIDQHAGTPADEVIVDSVTYEVQTVDEWPTLGPIPRSWQALAVRRAELPPVGGP